MNRYRQRARYWLAARLPACNAVVRTASDSLDRRIGLRASALIRLHYAVCAPCRLYEQQLRVLRVTVRDRPGRARAPGLPAVARERLRERLRATREKRL